MNHFLPIFSSLDLLQYNMLYSATRIGSSAAATSKLERFVIIVNGFQPLTIITKRSILDVPTALDTPLAAIYEFYTL